jgi:hypothetical protein
MDLLNSLLVDRSGKKFISSSMDFQRVVLRNVLRSMSDLSTCQGIHSFMGISLILC